MNGACLWHRGPYLLRQCCFLCLLGRSFSRVVTSGSIPWQREARFEKVEISTLLYATLFLYMHRLPVAFCRAFDGSQKHATELARTVIEEKHLVGRG